MNNHGANHRSVLFEDFFCGQAEMPVHIQLCLTVANVGAGTGPAIFEAMFFIYTQAIKCNA